MTRAVRALAARPGFTITAIATLALGLGVNAAIFSLTRAMLLRPIPYRDADRLATVFETNQSRNIPTLPVTPVNYVAWRERVTAFEQTAVFVRVQFNVLTPTGATQVEGFRTDEHFFPMLGIQPALGRGFTRDDTVKGRDDVALLTDGFWRRQFAADPGVIGRRLTVDGTPCVVIGVLPPSFAIFRVLNRELDMFRPIVIDSTDREHAINVWAKLRPGATIESARAQLAAVYATLPTPDSGWSATANLMSERLAAYSRSILPLLEAAVGLVLLIACANVASLLLAIAAARQKELAVRLALGASRWRVAKDLAGESALLAGAGAMVGVVLAVWIVAIFNSVISYQDLNRSAPFEVDRWVLMFTIVLGVTVALAFGLLPARVAGTLDVVDALKDSAHGNAGATPRLRKALIVGELALSIVLAASAAVLARSALALYDLPRGIAIERAMTAQVALNDARYKDPDRLVRATRAIAERLKSSPGIMSAAVVNYLPLALIRVGVPVTIDGQMPPGNQPPVARYFVIDSDYLRVAGIPVVAGRHFTAADEMRAAPVAIVSETFARRFWNGDAIGRHVTPEFPRSDAFWIPRSKNGTRTIVGVVRDVREDGIPDAAGFPQLYLPYAQNPTVVVTLLARAAAGSAATVAPAIRKAVADVDPQLPVSYEMSFDDVLRETFARPRQAAWLIAAFALLAFTLAAVGVYGLTAHATAARAREIAIRVALGATRADIVSSMVREAMTLTAIGVGIGAATTPLSLGLAQGRLFGVGRFDPWTLAGVSTVLAIISGGAAAIPAYRAARAGEEGAARV